VSPVIPAVTRPCTLFPSPAVFRSDRVREFAPEIPTSLGTNGTADVVRAVRAGEAPPPTPGVALQVPRTFGDIVVVDEAFVAAAHDHGLAVHVWTIDDEQEMADLIAVGVDGVMTDRPQALEAVLSGSGAPRP
jgi:glycerophosphoryl diester phosphodiesterase